MNTPRAPFALLSLLAVAAAPGVAHAIPNTARLGVVAHGTDSNGQASSVAVGDGDSSSGVVMHANSAGARPPADVPWVEVREPFRGGAVPPGAQVEYQRNMPLLGGGAAAFGVGYALAIYGAVSHPVGLIPLVGPFIAAGQTFSTPREDGTVDSTGGTIAIFSGVLQIAGVGAFIAGVLLPRRFLVFDVPANSPNAHQPGLRFSFSPGGPAGAPVGAALAATF